MLPSRAINILESAGFDVDRDLGNGEIRCYCPFHEDSTPSLDVNAYTGKYLCRAGCVSGYSIDDLIYKLTGQRLDLDSDIDILDIKSKLKRLFRKTEDKKFPVIPYLPEAIDNPGCDFLVNRGIDKDSIMNWNLQWWEEREAVVIPITGIGYIQRFIKTSKTKDKYKYISGTKITDCLFGADRARAINGSLMLVEGSLDVVYLHQLGFVNALGLLHNRLSDNQLKLLREQGGHKIYVMMDNDQGGDIGVKDIIPKLRKYFLVYLCELPSNKDPNECTIEEIKEVLKNKKLV